MPGWDPKYRLASTPANLRQHVVDWYPLDLINEEADSTFLGVPHTAENLDLRQNRRGDKLASIESAVERCSSASVPS